MHRVIEREREKEETRAKRGERRGEERKGGKQIVPDLKAPWNPEGNTFLKNFWLCLRLMNTLRWESMSPSYIAMDWVQYALCVGAKVTYAVLPHNPDFLSLLSTNPGGSLL